MSDKVFLFKGNIKDFLPIFAIKMATNQRAVDELSVINVEQSAKLPMVSKSVLNGILSNEMLEYYKRAYAFLYQAQFHEDYREIARNMWDCCFSDILQHAKEIAAATNEFRLDNLYHLMCDNSFLDSLCVCGVLSSTTSITCSEMIRTDIFGAYLELFTNDCNIDTEFSQFLDIPNSVLYRKYLLFKLNLDEHEYGSSKKKIKNDANGISFDVNYRLEDTLLKSLIKNGFNPYSIKHRIKEVDYSPPTISRHLSVYDKLVFDKKQEAVIVKTEELLFYLMDELRNVCPIQYIPIEQIQIPDKKEPEESEQIKEIQELTEQLNNLKRKNDLLMQKVSKQENTIRVLREEVQKECQLKVVAMNEKKALEDLVCSIHSDENAQPILDTNVINLLYQSKGVIIGGHQHFVNKLKPYLPLWTIIDTNNAAKGNWSAIKEAQVVVIQTQYLAHNTYYQAMNLIENKDKVIFTKQNNVFFVLKDIYLKLSTSI